MNYSLVNIPAVKIDIIKAVSHYQNVNSELAKQFLLRIREAKTYIHRYPLSFQIKYKEVRTVLLKQFPYHIHYLVEDRQKKIIIIAIVSAYKNPTDYSDK